MEEEAHLPPSIYQIEGGWDADNSQIKHSPEHQLPNAKVSVRRHV